MGTKKTTTTKNNTTKKSTNTNSSTKKSGTTVNDQAKSQQNSTSTDAKTAAPEKKEKTWNDLSDAEKKQYKDEKDYNTKQTKLAEEADRKKRQEEAEKAAAERKKGAQENLGELHNTENFLLTTDIMGKGLKGGQWITGAKDNGKTFQEATKNLVENAGDLTQDDIDVIYGKQDVSRIKTLDNEAFLLTFGIPDWGVENYLKERDSWQKQLDTITGEPGWFYFKIFFKFNTGFGLLGDIISEVSYHNSAFLYFANLYKQAYWQEMIETRAKYLQRFVKTLNFISTKAPWFFKGVKGLDKCGNAYINDFTKEKSIEIECSEDAVDMRLTTLLEMYKFVAFDEVNCKEILPENLRKFDMSIVLFHVPIKFWQTRSKINSKDFKPKSFNPGAEKDTLSYKMYTFLNCEIDPASLGIMTPNNINNEQPFQLGKNSIKINYDRCYNHLANEWTRDIFGADGAKRLGSLQNLDRKNAIKKAYDIFISFGENKNNITSSKPLIDVTENLINTLFDGEDFGIGDDNTYYIGEQPYTGYIGPKSKHSEEHAPQHEESDYYRDKLKLIKGRAKPGENIGNLYNYEVGPGTVYFENKMKALKGHGHQMSLYQYLIGPYSPTLNRKESDYFRRKMEILHHGGNVDNPGIRMRPVIPKTYGWITPYQEKYNQWLFDFKYSNTLKKTATYNPYGYVGKSNKMSTTVSKSYLGKVTRDYLSNTLSGIMNKIKPKFLR